MAELHGKCWDRDSKPMSQKLFLLQNFINEAETMLNSSPTRNVGGSTPGVIGAQEVYR